MSTIDRQQPLISQWVQRPLGTRTSHIVNHNSITIKKKTAVVSKINKAVISTVLNNEKKDISALYNVLKVSPIKVILNTSSQDKKVPILVDKSTSTLKVATSFSSQILVSIKLNATNCNSWQ